MTLVTAAYLVTSMVVLIWGLVIVVPTLTVKPPPTSATTPEPPANSQPPAAQTPAEPATGSASPAAPASSEPAAGDAGSPAAPAPSEPAAGDEATASAGTPAAPTASEPQASAGTTGAPIASAPAASDESSEAPTADQPPSSYSEGMLLLAVAMAGALGGLVHAARSLYWYAGNRDLRWSWLLMYYVQPLVGGALGAIFYLVIRGGFIPEHQSGNALAFVAVAALVGLFSQEAILKLKDVAETIFKKAPPGSEAIPQEPRNDPGAGGGDNPGAGGGGGANG